MHLPGVQLQGPWAVGLDLPRSSFPPALGGEMEMGGIWSQSGSFSAAQPSVLSLLDWYILS